MRLGAALALTALACASPGCDACGSDREPAGAPSPLAGVRPGQGDAADAMPRDARIARIARIDRALARGAEYLVARQDPDGGFRSATYAAFRDGYSLAPLSLLALWFVRSSEVAPPPGTSGRPGQDQAAALARAYQRGVAFVASLVTAEGDLRSGLDGPSYPYYAIAGALLVLNTSADEDHDAARQALVEHLRARQMIEARGWTPEDASYGGWGYFPSIPDKDATGGAADPRLTANLSATLFSLGALRLAGVPADDPALAKARVFVERCQNLPAPGASAASPGGLDDGGFFFSPAIPDANKAGVAGTDEDGRVRYRSYGSMTADGLRALVRLGLPSDHERVQAAAAWLTEHFDPTRNPGAFPPEAEVRRASGYYYYVWSSAHALRAVGATLVETEAGPVHWAEAMAEALLERQQGDGSWSNPYTELREDDPLVATPFAMAGLATARMVLSRRHVSHGRDGAKP